MTYSPKLPPTSVEMRVFRTVDGEIRNYFPVRFKSGRAGIDMYLRRLRVFGMLAPEYTGFAIDALDEIGDILETWNVTPRGMAWLRRELKLRMEPREVLR